MSWQAMEAVQDHFDTEEHTGLCIMYAIARSANERGIVGANGRLTAPSIDTIADRAHCHRNTVLNWLPRLEADGVLRIEKFGKGRGAWNRYTILLPMPAEEKEEKEPEKDPLETLAEMVQGLVIMVQGTNERLDLMVQESVHNGTPWDGLDTKDTEETTTPQPPKDEKPTDAVGVGAVFSAYENEIGQMTKVISDNIASAIDEFGPQKVIDAIEIAARNNARRWSYVDGVLANWRVNGYQSKGSNNGRSNGHNNGAAVKSARIATDNIGGYHV